MIGKGLEFAETGCERERELEQREERKERFRVEGLGKGVKTGKNINI